MTLAPPITARTSSAANASAMLVVLVTPSAIMLVMTPLLMRRKTSPTSASFMPTAVPRHGAQGVGVHLEELAAVGRGADLAGVAGGVLGHPAERVGWRRFPVTRSRRRCRRWRGGLLGWLTRNGTARG